MKISDDYYRAIRAEELIRQRKTAPIVTHSQIVVNVKADIADLFFKQAEAKKMNNSEYLEFLLRRDLKL